MSLVPNSRFMKAFPVIWPVQPAGWSPRVGLASWKKRSMKGTVSWYFMRGVW